MLDVACPAAEFDSQNLSGCTLAHLSDLCRSHSSVLSSPTFCVCITCLADLEEELEEGYTFDAATANWGGSEDTLYLMRLYCALVSAARAAMHHFACQVRSAESASFRDPSQQDADLQPRYLGANGYSRSANHTFCAACSNICDNKCGGFIHGSQMCARGERNEALPVCLARSRTSGSGYIAVPYGDLIVSCL